MTFFQNLFNDYEASWPSGDEKGYSLNAQRQNYKIRGNQNSPEVYIAWNEGPYDLSSDGDLTINYALTRDLKQYYTIVVDVTGSTAASTTVFEVKDNLNSDTSFSQWFTADFVSSKPDPSTQKIAIVPKQPQTSFHFYISNSGAENALRFNKMAGVADIPSYFDRDTIENRYVSNSLGQLVRLSHPIEEITAATVSEITSTAHGLSTGDIVYIVGSNSDPTIDGSQTISVTSDDTFVIPVTVTVAGDSGEWLSAIEEIIVSDAGLNYEDMLLDWEHLKGECKNYDFTKNTFDGSDRIVEQISWPAGAVAGQTAKKTLYTYSGTATTPETVIEIPYTLKSADLIYP